MLKVKHRNLPHWTIEGSVYYVTFKLLFGTLSRDEISLVLDHIKSGHNHYYQLISVQVMPNHVHCILKPVKGFTLSRIQKGIKGVSARLINQHRNESGTIWQDESFDRIVRNEKELTEKLKYMYENPLKAGMVDDPDDYYGWFIQE